MHSHSKGTVEHSERYGCVTIVFGVHNFLNVLLAILHTSVTFVADQNYYCTPKSTDTNLHTARNNFLSIFLDFHHTEKCFK